MAPWTPKVRPGVFATVSGRSEPWGEGEGRGAARRVLGVFRGARGHDHVVGVVAAEEEQADEGAVVLPGSLGAAGQGRGSGDSLQVGERAQAGGAKARRRESLEEQSAVVHGVFLPHFWMTNSGDRAVSMRAAFTRSVMVVTLKSAFGAASPPMAVTRLARVAADMAPS
jgi:hypothetical protein